MAGGRPHPSPLPGGEGGWISAFAGMTSCAKVSLRGNDGRNMLRPYGLTRTSLIALSIGEAEAVEGGVAEVEL